MIELPNVYKVNKFILNFHVFVQVFVNGREFCSFEFRLPMQKVSTLQIHGDVLINTCAIIHVSHKYIHI